MGIGLSAQGVNMNRLPGKMTHCLFSFSVHSSAFGCGEMNLSVSVSQSVSLVYYTRDLFNCICVGVISSVNLLSGRDWPLIYWV